MLVRTKEIDDSNDIKIVSVNNSVPLCTPEGVVIGEADKMQVHKKAILHRAVSVFIFNRSKELLLQQRAFHKYHSGGLWSNSCCTHPLVGESTQKAAERRLLEELGMSSRLRAVGTVIYNHPVSNNLYENEVTDIFIGFSNHTPIIDPTEVRDLAWIKLDNLYAMLKKSPNCFTPWLPDTLKPLMSYLIKVKEVTKQATLRQAHD
jgi:isopentenyl-diphosphate delta-isomerase